MYSLHIGAASLLPTPTLAISWMMQDIEFTVQENRLWMLQCRSGKRTGQGAVKIAVDLVSEGLVDRNTAIKMVEPGHLDQLLHPQVMHNHEFI
jgi:phosphoenolpyruvate synthase/pyruvate phosphate dikinase